MNEKNAIKTEDQMLLRKIQDRIRWDIRVSNSDIYIGVKSGIVSLHGYFDKEYRHFAVIDIISTTAGVKKLKDQSHVVGDYFRTDKELEVLISKQILTFPFLTGEWIDVEVNEGVAKLKGRVFRSRLKAYAARAAWELSGIRDCINLIELHFSPEEVPLERFNFQYVC